MEEANGFVWEDPDESPIKDRPFNAWRVPKSDSAKRVVDEVLTQLQHYEALYGLRKRKRRALDQEAFEHTVSAVVCDMIYHHLTHGPDQRVYIPRSKRVLGRKSIYRPPAFGKTLPAILDRLACPEMSFILMSKGEIRPFGKAMSTTIQAGSSLLNLIDSTGVYLHDLGKIPGAEVIHLKREREDYWDDGGLSEYDDDETTNLYRGQVHEINAWLDTLDIMFDEMVLADDRHVDTDDRSLRRIFTKGRFDRGGRLFGGFWQPLGKSVRLQGLYLGGERIVELDYGQMGPRILYGLYNAVPPTADAYTIPGYERFRKGVKKVFNSLIYDEKARERMPKGIRKHIPERYRFHDLLRAIERAHPDIAKAFGTGIGHEVQFHESQILVSLLLNLKAEGIPALPIHDAVLVPLSMKDDANRIMLKAFKDHTGIEGVVTLEHDPALYSLDSMRMRGDMRTVHSGARKEAPASNVRACLPGVGKQINKQRNERYALQTGRENS